MADVNVWQKPYNIVISLQLIKINGKKIKNIKKPLGKENTEKIINTTKL